MTLCLVGWPSEADHCRRARRPIVRPSAEVLPDSLLLQSFAVTENVAALAGSAVEIAVSSKTEASRKLRLAERKIRPRWGLPEFRLWVIVLAISPWICFIHVPGVSICRAGNSRDGG